MNRKNRMGLFSSKSITLVELLISVVIVSLMVLSFYSIDTFSRNQVLNSERRANVQNQLAYALEHMSKYVQQANGNLSMPAIVYFPAANPNSFGVQVDFNGTPSDYSDDPWVWYRLTDNTLKVSCIPSPPGMCPASFDMDLSARVRNGVVDINPPDLFPAPFPPLPPPAANPRGFYMRIDDNGSSIEIGLVGRYLPTQPVSISNPQVAMKTKLICNSCSTN